MMITGIAPLLVASAAGYWVLTNASKEKGRMKKLGQILGLIIVVVSMAGAACKVYYLVSACQSGMAMSGKAACPFPFFASPAPASK